jgi:hypothetical protein
MQQQESNLRKIKHKQKCNISNTGSHSITQVEQCYARFTTWLIDYMTPMPGVTLGAEE